MAQGMLRQLRGQLRQASRKLDFTWRYTFNLAPTLAYRRNPRSLTGEATRALDELNRNGVVVTSAQALLGEPSCYQELCAAVDNLECDLAAQLAAARAAVTDPDATGQKPYLFHLLGIRPTLDSDSIYVRFALQKPIAQIADAYFGMRTRISECNVWHTFVTQGPAQQSQFWHRDPIDRHILKVFVNLTDVDDGSGPFTYASGTHAKARLRREPAYLREDGSTKRSDDHQMAEVVPPERWVKGIGPKGTMIFADTRGYHKGGLAREHDRILYVCVFVSPGCGF